MLFVAWLCVASAANADDSIYEFYTGGAKREDTLPLILLLHGGPSSPQEIAPLLEKLPVRARIFASRALFPAGTGWAWYAAHPGIAPAELAAGITNAADVLVKLLDAAVRARHTCGRPIVVGVSQGGVLSYALAARTPAVVAAAFPICGFIPRSLVPSAKPANAPRIEAFHGDADEIIPIDLDRETSSALTKAGFQSVLKVYAGVGHMVANSAAPDLYASIIRTLSEMGCNK